MDGRGTDTLNDFGQIGGINASREINQDRSDLGDLSDLGGAQGLSGLGGIQANIANRPGLPGLDGRQGVRNGLRGLGDVSANQNLGGLRGLGQETQRIGLNGLFNVRGSAIGGGFGANSTIGRLNSFGRNGGLRGLNQNLASRGQRLQQFGNNFVQAGLDASSRSNRSVQRFGRGKSIPGGARQASVVGLQKGQFVRQKSALSAGAVPIRPAPQVVSFRGRKGFAKKAPVSQRFHNGSYNGPQSFHNGSFGAARFGGGFGGKRGFGGYGGYGY